MHNQVWEKEASPFLLEGFLRHSATVYIATGPTLYSVARSKNTFLAQDVLLGGPGDDGLVCVCLCLLELVFLFRRCKDTVFYEY